MDREAVPTLYGGVTFRSHLEADWARFLDDHRIRWEYEPERITLPSGAVYVPDFRLADLGTWLEVKGDGIPRVEKTREFAASLACRCAGACTCGWPGGELVLIGHPPGRYDATRDSRFLDDDWASIYAAERRFRGHPRWTAAHGRTAYFTTCQDCGTAGWLAMAAPPRCRACRGRLVGAHLYPSGNDDLLMAATRRAPADEFGLLVDLGLAPGGVR